MIDDTVAIEKKRPFRIYLLQWEHGDKNKELESGNKQSGLLFCGWQFIGFCIFPMKRSHVGPNHRHNHFTIPRWFLKIFRDANVYENSCPARGPSVCISRQTVPGSLFQRRICQIARLL